MISISGELIEEDLSSTIKNPSSSICNCIDPSSVRNDGHQVCVKCGFILATSDISENPDWNNYDFIDNSRCSIININNVNPYIDTLSTYIQKGSVSYIVKDGKNVRTDICRLHIQNSYNNKHISFNIVENIYDNVSEHFTKRIILTAKNLWNNVMEKKIIVRAGPRKGLIAACLFYACVKHDCPRTQGEICQIMKCLNKDFNKGEKIFKDNLIDQDLIIKSTSISNYFNRYLYELSIDNVYTLSEKCREFYERVKDRKEIFAVSQKSLVLGIISHIAGIPKQVIIDKYKICMQTLTKAITILTTL